eukprot:1801957-Amphidinium_carterae.1
MQDGNDFPNKHTQRSAKICIAEVGCFSFVPIASLPGCVQGHSPPPALPAPSGLGISTTTTGESRQQFEKRRVYVTIIKAKTWNRLMPWNLDVS